MTPDRQTRIEALFKAALERPEAVRELFLRDECSSDRALYGEVQALLSLDRSAEGFLEQPRDAALIAPQMQAVCGDGLRIGRDRATRRDLFSIDGYELMHELGYGGQGVVYQAVQHSTRRHVAIKILRHGVLATKGQQARLDREVRILAQLKHPGIVTIHDSGRSGNVSYVVMDYIDGVPLDAYVASAHPSLNDRVELFIRTADAVNGAHLRGVIHRDLKPANILIDAEGHPHVLDFGLAKLDDGSTHFATMTQTGQFIGSLPWSAPEQARGQHERVNMRTDVYALGVIFWQVLTGEFPYEVSGDIQSTLYNITVAQPTSTSSGTRLKDDLKTILRKCLAKEPERRYQNAGELAADLSAYVDHRPISARRDSALYVLKTTMRRHWVATLAMLTAFVVAVGSAVGFALMYRHAEQARLAAETDRKAANQTLANMQRGLFTTVPPLPSFSDDFDDGLMNARFFHEGNVFESNGALLIDTDGWCGSDPAQFFLRGDFDISVDFQCDLPELDVGAVHCGLYAVDPHTAKPMILISRYREHNPQCNGWPEDRFQAILGPSEDCGGRFAPTDVQAGRLRIARRGTTASMYYWSEGWRELLSGPVSDKEVGFRLFSRQFFSTEPPSARFDNLRVTTVVPPDPLCLDALDDAFEGQVIDPRFMLKEGYGYPREADGMLLLRKQNGKPGWLGCTLDPTRFRLCGDFSISVDYALLEFPTQDADEHFLGLQILDVTAQNVLVGIERVRSFSNAEPHRDAYRTVGRDAPRKMVTAGGSKGRLRIVREEDRFRLSYLDAKWHDLDVAECADSPVIFQLYSGADGDQSSHLVGFDHLHLSTPSSNARDTQYSSWSRRSPAQPPPASNEP